MNFPTFDIGFVIAFFGALLLRHLMYKYIDEKDLPKTILESILFFIVFWFMSLICLYVVLFVGWIIIAIFQLPLVIQLLVHALILVACTGIYIDITK